jgi:hypothetical protein
VPFKGSFDTAFQSVLEFPLLRVSVTGQGHASHLGRTKAVTTDEVVNLLDGSASATCALPRTDRRHRHVLLGRDDLVSRRELVRPGRRE